MHSLLYMFYFLFPSSFFVFLIACLVNKMGHLLKLAQEYQAKGVLDLCVKCLQDVQKSEENVVKVLSLANCTVTTREDSRLDSVRGECNHLIKNMELSNVKGKRDFNHLDRDSLESLYVERTGRLETFLKEIYSQFVGLVEYSLHLSLQSSHCGITRCPQHFPLPGSSSKANSDLLDRLDSCSVCREMIAQLVSSSKTPYPLQSVPSVASMPSKPVQSARSVGTGSVVGSLTTTSVGTGSLLGYGTTGSGFPGFGKQYHYGGSYHFDQKLISIIQDFKNVISLPSGTD